VRSRIALGEGRCGAWTRLWRRGTTKPVHSHVRLGQGGGCPSGTVRAQGTLFEGPHAPPPLNGEGTACLENLSGLRWVMTSIRMLV
jgi:hypothetical protein